MTEFYFTPRFNKEFHDIEVRDLKADLNRWEDAFRVRNVRLSGIEGPIPGLHKKGVTIPVYKVKEFRCKQLNRGSRSGIRIIFAYDSVNEVLLYLQIYVKNKKENHDEKHIIDVLKGKESLREIVS